MLPIQITYRSMLASPTIEDHLNKYYKKIKRIHPKISHCHAVVSLIHKHKHKGKFFSISLDLALPGRRLICKKINKNIYLAIKDVFDAIEKLIEKRCKKKLVRPNRHYLYQRIEGQHENSALSISSA